MDKTIVLAGEKEVASDKLLEIHFRSEILKLQVRITKTEHFVSALN
ncbi:hypothetical protein [Odoribacter laneus]